MNMKKRVYFVQPGYIYGDESKTAFLPYAAGTVAAYAFDDAAISEKYEFAGFIWSFEAIEAAVEKLSDAEIVGFSNYVWNYDYNCCLAKRLKELYPDCRIVFGGHQISDTVSQNKELDFVDCYIVGEGEVKFADYLRASAGLPCCDDLSRNSGNDSSACTYPSPYLMGLFDEIVQNNPDISFTALFETNRGCPYGCAYCDWGSTADKIRFFTLERVFDEIRWFSRKKIVSCFAADANFGLFERDRQIASFLIDTNKETGYPKRFDVTYAKSDNENVISIACDLFNAGMSNGPSISFQSLHQPTLASIGRKNLTPEKFTDVIRKYEENGLRPYSEIILGLPEETYESFINGIGTLMKLGQQNYIDIFRCEILPNSVLSDKSVRDRYMIETVSVASTLHHIDISEAGKSYGHSDIVVSTSSMNREEMLLANLFSMVVQACHYMGLTKYIAIYLNRIENVSYSEFYNQLLKYLSDNILFSGMKKIYSDYLNGTGNLDYFNNEFGAITWFPEEGFFLETIKSPDGFYSDILPVLQKYISDYNLCKELIEYQKMSFVLPHSGIKEAEFSYNFYDFFMGRNDKFEHIGEKVYIEYCDYADWEDCARHTVWYGRRRGKTDAFVSNKKITVKECLE